VISPRASVAGAASVALGGTTRMALSASDQPLDASGLGGAVGF